MSYGKIFPLGGSGGSTPSGIAGAIQFSNGSAFASDAANLFWDDTNNRLGIGTNAPTQVLDIVTTTQIPLKLSNNQTFVRTLYSNNSASGTFDFINNYFSFGGNNLVVGSSSNLNARLGVVGSGSTSATTSLLVQNSAGNNAINVKDDLTTTLGGELFTSAAGITLPNGNGPAKIYGSNNDGILRIQNTNSFVKRIDFLDNTSAVMLSINTGSIAIGTTTINASAKLQVDSTTQGFLPPRMTTTQRDAIVTPAIGLTVYNTSTNTTDTFDGTTFQKFGQQTLIKGSGSTSATTSLLVQNSSGTNLISVVDNGNITQTTGNATFYNGVTVQFSGIQCNNNGPINTGGNITATGTSSQIGQLQILSTGNASTSGLGISFPEATMVFQGYTLGATSVGSQFTFRNFNNTTSPLNFINSGLLRITSIGFQSGNANNLSGNTLWIEPIYNLTDPGRSGTTVRGIYYNPTLTSLVNTNHYGIQTTSGGAYINTATPAASAALQADSTTQGFLPPRMTTAQKNAIATPAEGLIVMDITLHKLCVYSGTAWETITSV